MHNEFCKLKITAAIQCICTICFSQQSHGRRKMNPLAIMPVKPFNQKSGAIFGEFFQFMFRDIQFARLCHLHSYEFPRRI